MEQQKNTSKCDNSRRKFLFKAAKAAPVVTTMTAMPVWASNVSISGNLSGNMSGQYQVAKFNGCSPGYYKAKNNNVNHRNNRLPAAEYGRKFHDLFPGSGGPDKTVQYLLKNSSDYKVERLLVSHYYNAYDSGHSGNAANFPYKQSEIIEFYNNIDMHDNLFPTISEGNAKTILKNLKHNGGPDPDLHGEC